MMKKVAILGATSHIAKGLIFKFLEKGQAELFLFARSPVALQAFLKNNALRGNIEVNAFSGFPRGRYDLVINCVGIGTPNKAKPVISSVFELTEEFDSLTLSYLKKYPHARLINFSSGAVYRNYSEKSGAKGSACRLEINNIRPEDYYSIAKINSEAKHRAYPDLHIADIRIFSYFSRFLDLDSGYFLADALKSIKEGRELVTGPCDFIRDYLGLEDLFSLINLTIKARPFNAALDAYSAKPVSKFQLLDFFTDEYGLRWKTDKSRKFVCPTGIKDIYCTVCRSAAKYGYKPQFSSLETIKAESKFILG